MIRKPKPEEYAPFYTTYIDLLEEENIVQALRDQLVSFSAFLDKINDRQSEFAYAPDKWSIKDVLNHINDVERIFAYRALCIARGEQHHLPGMDENAYQAASPTASRAFDSLSSEFVAIRTTSLFFFDHLPEIDSLKMGKADGKIFSVRALGAILVGHCQHHQYVIENRYLSCLS